MIRQVTSLARRRHRGSGVIFWSRFLSAVERRMMAEQHRQSQAVRAAVAAATAANADGTGAGDGAGGGGGVGENPLADQWWRSGSRRRRGRGVKR